MTPYPSDFAGFIQMHKETIYARICDYLPSGKPEEHHKMVRCYVDRKGQYRRPSYVLLWTLLYGGQIEDAVLPAAVQQVSEDWILIHDDWEDGNALRRGKEAAHVLYGDRFAINAGDHLHMVNWKMAKDAADSLGDSRGNDYFEKFYDIMQVTCRGQYLDMKLTHDIKDISGFSPEDYFRSIHAKAAYYSVYGPMQCGAIVAGASREAVEKIAIYGIPAGKAFQIRDDILDCSSSEARLGKSIGNDVWDGCKTLILWHAARTASPTILSKLKEIYGKPREEKTEEEVSWVLEQFRDLGSLDHAGAEAVKLTAQSIELFDEIESHIPESPLKALARDSLGYAAQRAV